ncbi:hypothetical protein AaE_009516 [Aphanomyces astaci]|uniref:Uncharacterized protein n=1 Tax=Aphanomyces astaci TaxID=112090 RepID=A0A6A5A7J3_APHAT|nr:hypothetical protein AaE_009516 [Aphanomyces astaci]
MQLYEDFCDPLYIAGQFRHLFRMNRGLFIRIMDTVAAADTYFVQKPDAFGKLGLSPLQKCTASMCMLAYGVCADSTDEYCRLDESTAIESMKRFARAVVSEFGPVYLREPNEEDV